MFEIAPSKNIVVLVVEDEPLILEATSDTLMENGFDVMEATNADDAVLILERHEDIGIIFSDIDMPGSMNGLKLAKVARLRWPPIEIILTSANVDLPLGELPERCLFIPKPYKCEHLVEKLRSLAR